LPGPSAAANGWRCGWPAAAGIAGVVLAIYLLTATAATFWDRDEPRFARATVEMVESGNYLYPTFNGELRPDKPILVYWLMSVPVRLFGPGELASRFFSAVGIALTCLLTYFIGRRVVGPRAGIWAMIVLAAAVMMIVLGTVATADAVMLPCIVGALAIFAHSLTGGVRIWHVIVLGLMCGLSMLAKGPMGLVPLLVIVGVLWFGRRRIQLGWRYLGYAALATLFGAVLFCAWAIPANYATDGELMRQFFGKHVFQRATEALEGHGGAADGKGWRSARDYMLYLPVYVPVVLLGFFPWTLHLPGALSAVIGGRVGGRNGRALLLGWLVVVFVGASLAATKLPHYVAAMWPAMALAVGGVLAADRSGTLTDRDRRWLRRGVWLFAPLAAGAGLGGLVGVWFLPSGAAAVRWPLLAGGVIVLLMGIVAVREHLAGRFRRSAVVMLIGMVITHGVVVFAVVPAGETFKIAPHVARAINERTGGEVSVATSEFDEPTMVYYLHRAVDRKIGVVKGAQDVVAWAADTAPGVLVVRRKDLDRIEKDHGPLGTEEIFAFKGLNYSKGRWPEIVAIGRNLPPRPADAP